MNRINGGHRCELCPRYRPFQVRAWGTGFIDTYWACPECTRAYVIELTEGGMPVWNAASTNQ